ncbi:hypothetical protein DPMN_049925 [Dreissena polymorpha]|uniref:Uncharacterized protein n=1 Tax=Dreissena polymorpha TaxID=45954 RepID=A0A9D4CGG6_DREPO|nr:hypothetical protein DPMN_049925 [Dreissena polymorpha]
MTQFQTQSRYQWDKYRTINVASGLNMPRRLGNHVFQPTGNGKALHPGGHVLKATGTIFLLLRYITGTNLPTKFHDDRKNVASKILMGIMTNFHEDRKINVASSVNKEKCPAPSPPFFSTKEHHFELVQVFIGMNLLTKFHEDWTINVVSRVKNAPPHSSHVFQAKITNFEIIQYIIGTNFLSKVLTRKNAPPHGGHVFQPIGIIFELFHEDQTINVASRVKNASPFCSHVFQANVTISKLIQDIIETNLLTKLQEDWTLNVASGELTWQMFTAHDARRTKGDYKSSP